MDAHKARVCSDRIIELGHQISAGNHLTHEETKRMWQFIMNDAANNADDAVVTTPPKKKMQAAPHTRNSGRWLTTYK